MNLGKLLIYLQFNTYVVIKCKGDIIAQGMAIHIADNMLNAEMWSCYDVIDITLYNDRLIINVAEGEY